MTRRGMVIIGAGEAGVAAARTLREAGWAGPVTVIGEEAHPPYERPPLSKAVMTDAEPALPRIAAAAALEEAGVALRCGTAATAIDRGRRTVRLADGESLAYEHLLLAAGAAPRPLSVPGGALARTLRRYADALAIRARLSPGRRLAVIGGGFIGLELAAAARARGAAVTVVEAAPRILTRAVPAPAAAAIAARHRAEGVDLREGTGVVAITERNAGRSVRLADDTAFDADLVVAGIGAIPETRLAAAAGLVCDNGIAVDGRLATSDPAIFAAGDCCSFPHPLYGGRRLRLEAWRNAQDQGAAAARAMLGATDAYAAVPWFWSDQYDLHLQIAGLPDEGASTVDRDLGEGARLAFHLAADGRLVAASGLGPIGRIAREVRLAERLIAAAARPDPAALAAPDVRLKSLLAA